MMSGEFPRLRPAGEAAVLVELGGEISPAANERVRALNAALGAAALAGIRETLPAYASLLVEYDPLVWSYNEISGRLLALAEAGGPSALPPSLPREVPTRYGGPDGPDLAGVAALHGLAPEQVIALHSGANYTVYMLGFSPGFAYMGLLPPEIATPRLATPRPRVPAGSVGIAGRQTGIYPQATPGGWRLLGRTDLALFDPYRNPPSLLGPEDRVRFVPVEQAAGSGSAVGTPGNAVGGASSPDHKQPGMWGTGRALLLQVVAPGWMTTVQDLGRPGYARLGVPASGALDPTALQAANLLCGNSPGAAGLEITGGGLALRALENTWAALAGADLGAAIYPPGGGPWPVEPWSNFFLRQRSVLELRGPSEGEQGGRAYLAVAGGLGTKPAMGSQSTYLPGGFGGYMGRALQAGDVLAAGESRDRSPGGTPVARTWPRPLRPAYEEVVTVRVVPGPHDDYFTPEALAILSSVNWHVSATSDRMGLRLEGPALEHRGAAEIVSCGTVPGAIQVPPAGLPIVLLADRQTAGGYPMIACVIRADLPTLAQLLPGQGQVRFRQVTIVEAQAAWRMRRQLRASDLLENLLDP